mmetsp:Transcript_50899/g.142447  ORF Transcript_50899/g.142447 Transcript_50899/m.142447 type:complete len:295 (-) Transcript_50899:1530-2414(-)
MAKLRKAARCRLEVIEEVAGRSLAHANHPNVPRVGLVGLLAVVGIRAQACPPESLKRLAHGHRRALVLARLRCLCEIIVLLGLVRLAIQDLEELLHELVHPSHACRAGVRAACEAVRRLQGLLLGAAKTWACRHDVDDLRDERQNVRAEGPGIARLESACQRLGQQRFVVIAEKLPCAPHRLDAPVKDVPQARLLAIPGVVAKPLLNRGVAWHVGDLDQGPQHHGIENVDEFRPVPAMLNLRRIHALRRRLLRLHLGLQVLLFGQLRHLFRALCRKANGVLSGHVRQNLACCRC